ncbi:MAG: hypothetical protein WC376_01200 [Candidatus Nanoarchaeia archaeon]|jgi:hypothetical protein
MQQDDLIDSIENPSIEPMSSQESTVNSAPKAITSLPEDLIIPKKEINVFGIINLISYITLGLAALFLLILYIIGLMK